MLTINGFKKFLVDEIIRQSSASYSEAFAEVQEFARQPEFEKHFKKWQAYNEKAAAFAKKPVHISNVLRRIGL